MGLHTISVLVSTHTPNPAVRWVLLALALSAVLFLGSEAQAHAARLNGLVPVRAAASQPDVFVVPGRGLTVRLQTGKVHIFLGMRRSSCCRLLAGGRFIWRSLVNDSYYQPGRDSELLIDSRRAIAECIPALAGNDWNWGCVTQKVEFGSTRQLIHVGFDDNDRVAAIVVWDADACLSSAPNICTSGKTSFSALKKTYGKRLRPYGGSTGDVFCGAERPERRPLRLLSAGPRSLGYGRPVKIATLFFSSNYNALRPQGAPTLEAVSIAATKDSSGRGC